jgi:hypothetical protein
MNRKMQTADGASAGFTLNAGNMGVYPKGLDCPLVRTNLKEVRT